MFINPPKTMYRSISNQSTVNEQVATVTAYNRQRDFKQKYSMDKLYCIQGIYNLIVVQVADSQAKILASYK